MEIFDELVESEVSIVTPHLKTLVEFCLQVCTDTQFMDIVSWKCSQASSCCCIHSVLCVCIINSTIISSADAIYINCLQIASNSTCGDNLRIKALYFVSWLARIKPKASLFNLSEMCCLCANNKLVAIIHYQFYKAFVSLIEYFRY